MKLPKFISQNILLKITSLNSVAVSIRLVLALVSQKIIAELLGPIGVKRLGDIRDIIPMIESFSSLGTFNGIVKYVAEHKENQKELQKLFSTVTVFSLLASILSCLILLFGASYFNELLFPNENYVFVFQILALAVPFIALNRVLNAIINGLSAYKTFVKINLASYVFSVILLLLMVYYKHTTGALIAVALTPILQFCIIGYLYYKTIKDYIKVKGISCSIPYKNELLAFTLMSLVATFLGRFVDLNIRHSIENQISEVDAGNWTALTNISKQYLMFMSAILTLYVIPKFATLKTSLEFRREVVHIYATVLPFFAIGMLVIFFLREWIVINLLTEEFIGMKPLFKWQLLGDFIKLASIIIAHQFLAKKMVEEFIISELISLVLFFGLSFYFVNAMGAEGVVYAHFLRYLMYFIIVLILLRKHLWGNHKIKG